MGLVIDDGFRYKKEELLLGILEKNQGAGARGRRRRGPRADPAKQSALLHVDGEVATDCVLVALFKTNAPFAALRSHWYLPTGRAPHHHQGGRDAPRAPWRSTASPRPSATPSCSACPSDELEFGKPKGFAVRPTALKVGREYFIRAPWKPLPDGSILFANLLEEGTELELMKMGDMAGITRSFFQEELPRRVQNPQAALLFHCSGRMWYAQRHGHRAATGGDLARMRPWRLE